MDSEAPPSAGFLPTFLPTPAWSPLWLPLPPLLAITGLSAQNALLLGDSPLVNAPPSVSVPTHCWDRRQASSPHLHLGESTCVLLGSVSARARAAPRAAATTLHPDPMLGF